MSDARPDLRPLSFLNFPGEVRNIIYPLLLVGPTHLDSPTASDDQTTDKALHPSILATCRQINTEGTPYLYGDNACSASINADTIDCTGSPDLISPSQHLNLTRDWRIIITLAEPETTWDADDEWEHNLEGPRARVGMLKQSLETVCATLSKNVPGLNSVRIQVDCAFYWEVRERYGEVGLRGLLDCFEGVRVEGYVEVKGTRKIVTEARLGQVKDAMLKKRVL